MAELGRSNARIVPEGAHLLGVWPDYTVLPGADSMKIALEHEGLGGAWTTRAVARPHVGLTLAMVRTELDVHKAFAKAGGGNAALVLHIGGDNVETVIRMTEKADSMSDLLDDFVSGVSDGASLFGGLLKWTPKVAAGILVGLLLLGVVLVTVFAVSKIKKVQE